MWPHRRRSQLPLTPAWVLQNQIFIFFSLEKILCFWQSWGIDSIFQAKSRNPFVLHHNQGTKQGPLLHRGTEAKAVSDLNYCSEEWNQAIFCNISPQLCIMFIRTQGFNWFNLAFQLWNKSIIHRRSPQCRREHKMFSWNAHNLASWLVKRPRSPLEKGLILSLLFTHHRLLFWIFPMKFHGSTCEIRS